MNKNSEIGGNKEILFVIETIAQEKNIAVESVIGAMEEGLKLAARKKYGHDLLVECKLDRKTGKITLYNKLEIVEDKAENEAEFDSKKQITITKAKSDLKKGKVETEEEIKIGGFVRLELPNIDLNRVVVQIARNEIIKKIKEAERDKEYDEFIDRVGTIINGSIKKIGIRNIVVEIDGYEALLTYEGMIPGERFRVGDRIRAYIKEVLKEQKGAQIFLSRTDNMFLAELFRQEVPEIYDGLIEIRGIARDPGSKAKVAVFSRNETSDIIGACVGIRGVRVQAVTNELRGEKIDVIRWSENTVEYIVSAISPAKPIKVIFNEDKNSADVVLPKDQLSLAIGRGGQNVKLASKITGIKIDVMTEEEEKTRRLTEFKEDTDKLMEILDVEEVIAQLLVAEGFNTVEIIANSDIDTLARIQGFNEDIAKEIQDRAIEFSKAQ
ncbi:MAG: transcription termination factor NusA [Rickettsiales bacterium]|nr:transcription termination factor NusA [Rickettsiales bacterium]